MYLKLYQAGMDSFVVLPALLPLMATKMSPYRFVKIKRQVQRQCDHLP